MYCSLCWTDKAVQETVRHLKCLSVWWVWSDARQVRYSLFPACIA